MKITNVETYIVDGGWRNFVFVNIHTDEDVTGVGEITATTQIPGIRGFEECIKELAMRYLIGKDPFNVEELWRRMFRNTFWRGGPLLTSVISGLEEALWDIIGKTLKTPIYNLLGGRCRDKIRLYLNGWYFGCGDAKDFAEKALEVKKQGFYGLKFDPFGSADLFLSKKEECEAVERVEAVREAVGDEVALCIDVHGRLTPFTAIKMAKKLEKFDPFFYEEPVPPDNVAALAKVSKAIDIPVATGERLYTKYGFREVLEKQAADIIQPDIGITGGMLETKKISAMAEARYIVVQPHNCNGPVATAAAIQIAANIPNFIIQEIFPIAVPWQDKIVNESYESKIRNGYLEVPKEPGLGIELNHEEVPKYPHKMKKIDLYKEEWIKEYAVE